MIKKNLDMPSLNIGSSHGHDYSNWILKLWSYYPIDYNYESYRNKCSWWIDKVPKLGNSIMEVGSYSGLACIWIKKNFQEKDVVAIDINPHICHFLKTRLYYFNMINDIPVYCEDGFNLIGFKDKNKDCIFSDGLAEHFDTEDRVKLLTEHLRVAKKVLIIVPTNVCLDDGIGGYGDEQSISYENWSQFMNKYFIVEEEFANEDKNHYGCILRDIK